MIFCTVNGGSKQERQLVEDAFYFVIEQLMPQKKNLDVEIWLTDMPYDDADGYHLHVDKYEHNIELQTGLIEEDLITALFHEMVHVKQYAQGELYESVKQGKHRWQGKWLPKDPEYWDRPWEIEAHGREVGLFVRWAEQNQLGAKSWTQDR